MVADGGPLRVLVVVSRPMAQIRIAERGGGQIEELVPVDLPPVEVARKGLRDAFLNLPVQVRFLPWARLEDIQAGLAEPYDVLHIIAHGSEDGCLVLEMNDGTADFVIPDRLVHAMKQAGIKLVVVSVCHSGKIGTALNKAGIPNVIMVDERYAITAEVASLFNRQFYARLARGKLPSDAFEAGVNAIRADRSFGDTAPPPINLHTGEIEPRHSERFDKLLGADNPLVHNLPAKLSYQELHPHEEICAVQREEVFVGREAETIQVIRNLKKTRVVTLTGPGGIGKTALGRRMAHWFAERSLFRDGIDEISLEGASEEADLTNRMLQAFKIQTDASDPWNRIRKRLVGNRLLLIDNAEDLTQEARKSLTESLLNRLPELHLLVTSREPLNLIGYEQTIDVEQLPVGQGDEAGSAEFAFIAYTPQKRQEEIVTKNFDIVRLICQELDGYPVGLLLAAAHLNDEKETPEHLLRLLRLNMIEALKHPHASNLPDRHKSLEAVLKSSHDKLSSETKNLLAHMALFPGGATEWMLGILEDSGWRKAEAELRRFRLVRWEGGRYRMLSPIRTWVGSVTPSASTESYRAEALQVLSEQLSQQSSRLSASEHRRKSAEEMAEVNSFPKKCVEEIERAMTMDALAYFDSERPNLLEAINWAYSDGYLTLVCGMALDLVEYFEFRSMWSSESKTLDLALDAARRMGNKGNVGQILTSIGSVYNRQGRWHDAIEKHKEALIIFREAGDHHNQAVVKNRLGAVYTEFGRWNDALMSYQEAHQEFQRLKNRRGMADTLVNMGWIHRLEGRWNEAIEKFKAGLSVFQELGDRRAEGITLSNLGLVYHAQGNMAGAIEHHSASLRIRQELRDRTGEGQALNNLGLVLSDQGLWEEAIKCFEQDLTICRELDDRIGEARTLGNLGDVHLRQGLLKKAMEYYEINLQKAREFGSSHGEAEAMNRIGLVYSNQNLWDEALVSFESGLHIFNELHSRPDIPQVLMNIGAVYFGQNRFAESTKKYEEAMKIFEDLGDRRGFARCLTNIANVEDVLGHQENALGKYDAGLIIYRNLGDSYGEGQTLFNIGVTYINMKQVSKAMNPLNDALRIFIDLGAVLDANKTKAVLESLSKN